MTTVEQIKELRNQTQVSVKLCHDALVATGNDMEKAKLWLRQKGSEVAGDGNAFGYFLAEDGSEKLQGVADGSGVQYKTDKVSIDIRGFDGNSPRTLWGSDRCMFVCRPVRA